MGGDGCWACFVVSLFICVLFCCFSLDVQSRALQCMMKGFECGFEGRGGKLLLRRQAAFKCPMNFSVNGSVRQMILISGAL